jgi:hypothetical protein
MIIKEFVADTLRLEVFYSPDDGVDIYDNSIDVISGKLPLEGSLDEPFVCHDQYDNLIELKQVVGYDCFSADLKEFSSIGELAISIKYLENTLRKAPNYKNIDEVNRLTNLISNTTIDHKSIGSIEQKYLALDIEELVKTAQDGTEYLLQGKKLEDSGFISKVIDLGISLKQAPERDTESMPSPLF